MGSRRATPPRASRSTSTGSGRCSTPAGRSCRGPRPTADATRPPMEWLIFEEEYYRAGGPQRVTQNGIFLLAPTVFAFGTQEQQDHILPRMAGAVDLWCQGWSEPNAGSDLAGIQSRAVRDEPTAVGGSRVRRPGRRGARSAPTSSGSSAPTPRPSATTASPTSSCRSTRPGSRCGASAASTATKGFAEVFFDDVFVGDDAVLGEVGKGWSVAMATTSAERGLTLRSPGRFMATAARLVDLYRDRRRRRAGDRRRDAVVRAWIDAEAYRWQTFQTVTRMTDGREPRRRVEPHEGVLVGPRRAPPRARARAARHRGRDGRGGHGRRASSSRSPVRSTRVPTRSSAT